jgi:zinc transport system substrate-binding protein
MRPSQAARLADSDLLIWLGPEMTPWLERSVASLAPDMPQLTLLDAPETYLRLFDDGKAKDDHAAHDDHSGHDDHTAHDDHAGHDDHTGHEGHYHSGIDPHAWLDPANARAWLPLIAARLSAIDPDNAATYGANATTAQAAIDALDTEIKALLAPVKDRPFVAAHDAYGYLTDHYGLRLVGTVALGDASSPGAARLATLRDTIAQTGAVCLFPEVQSSPDLLTELASDTGTRIGGPLDPSGTSLDAGPDAYAALMRNLATTLADCLTP